MMKNLALLLGLVLLMLVSTAFYAYVHPGEDYVQVFSVYAGENVLLQCPFCKNHWKASRGRGLAECPHCRQYVEPRVVKIGK